MRMPVVGRKYMYVNVCSVDDIDAYVMTVIVYGLMRWILVFYVTVMCGVAVTYPN